jgi:hypothetical protein
MAVRPAFRLFRERRANPGETSKPHARPATCRFSIEPRIHSQPLDPQDFGQSWKPDVKSANAHRRRLQRLRAAQLTNTNVNPVQ